MENEDVELQEESNSRHFTVENLESFSIVIQQQLTKVYPSWLKDWNVTEITALLYNKMRCCRFRMKMGTIEEAYLSICLNSDDLLDVYALDFKGAVLAYSLDVHINILHNIIEAFTLGY